MFKSKSNYVNFYIQPTIENTCKIQAEMIELINTITPDNSFSIGISLQSKAAKVHQHLGKWFKKDRSFWMRGDDFKNIEDMKEYLTLNKCVILTSDRDSKTISIEDFILFVDNQKINIHYGNFC